MTTIIEAVLSDDTKRQAWCTEGQSIEIGRGALVDLSIPEDSMLSDVHFRIQWLAGQCVTCATAGSEIMVNGLECHQSQVRDGDDIVAGSTRFRVTTRRHGGQSSAPQRNDDSHQVHTLPPLANVDDGPQSTELANGESERADLNTQVSGFVNLDDYTSAINCLTDHLSLENSILWATHCASRVPHVDSTEKEVLRIVDPSGTRSTEEVLQQLAPITSKLRKDRPVFWVAQAIKWSIDQPALELEAVRSSIHLSVVASGDSVVESYQAAIYRGLRIARTGEPISDCQVEVVEEGRVLKG